MGILPDITPDGGLDIEKGPSLYTPPGKRVTPHQRENWDIRKDTFNTHLKDAPTMDNIHECEENISGVCHWCGREMPA